MAVAEVWKDPITYLDLADDQVVTEINWDDLISNVLYVARKVSPNLQNKSGGAVGVGDVVIADSANDSAFVGNTVAGLQTPVMVVLDTIGSNLFGRVAQIGVVVINYTGSAPARGDFLELSNVSLKAKGVGAYKTPGSFARCMAAGSGGSVVALLLSGIGGPLVLQGTGTVLFLPHANSSASNASPTTNTVYVYRQVIPVGMWVNTIAFGVETAEASKFASIAIWDLTGTVKIIDSGALSIASTGIKSTTLGTPVYLPPGIYLVAFVSDRTSGAFTGVAIPSGSSIWNSGAVAGMNTAANAGVAGAQPASLGVLTGTNFGLAPVCRLAG